MRKTLVLLILTFSLTQVNAQCEPFHTSNETMKSTEKWVEILNAWASKHFYDCFGYRFVQFYCPDRIYEFNDQFILEGTVGNLGNLGNEVQREYSAKIVLDPPFAYIKFTKQMVGPWPGYKKYKLSCTKKIYLPR